MTVINGAQLSTKSVVYKFNNKRHSAVQYLFLTFFVAVGPILIRTILITSSLEINSWSDIC